MDISEAVGDKYQAVFEEGRSGAVGEYGIESNPHPFGSVECTAWLLGYYYEITELGHE